MNIVWLRLFATLAILALRLPADPGAALASPCPADDSIGADEDHAPPVSVPSQAAEDSDDDDVALCARPHAARTLGFERAPDAPIATLQMRRTTGRLFRPPSAESIDSISDKGGTPWCWSLMTTKICEIRSAIS